MRHHDRSGWDRKRRALLPYLAGARSLGFRRLDDLLAAVAPLWLADHPHRPLTRSTLRRTIVRLQELGLDPGLDDLATARKLGRPTRAKKLSG